MPTTFKIGLFEIGKKGRNKANKEIYYFNHQRDIALEGVTPRLIIIGPGL
jgi:hypothetical protein